MPQPILFRRSPHVVGYWKHGEFVLHNYATRRVAGATAATCEILDLFSSWKPISELYAAKPGVNRSALRQLVTGLVEVTLLQRSDRQLREEDAMGRFERWNPEAGLFHTASKDVRFTDPQTAERLLGEQAATWPMPPPVKRYPGAPVVRLAPPDCNGPVEDAFLARRTWRRFGAGSIPVRTFGALLAVTAAVQKWVTVPGQGEVALKTAPSGGARHPIEVYVLAWGIAGLGTGLYHYLADAHALELLEPGLGADRVAEYFPQAGYLRHACAVVLFSAVYERDLWRYPYSRAYRAPLIEAGHLCQTFCVLATAYGLAPFCLMGLADSVIEGDLRIDGVAESVLYAAGIGIRPANADWAPAPPGFAAPDIRENTPK